MIGWVSSSSYGVSVWYVYMVEWSDACKYIVIFVFDVLWVCFDVYIMHKVVRRRGVRRRAE